MGRFFKVNSKIGERGVKTGKLETRQESLLETTQIKNLKKIRVEHLCEAEEDYT